MTDVITTTTPVHVVVRDDGLLELVQHRNGQARQVALLSVLTAEQLAPTLVEAAQYVRFQESLGRGRKGARRIRRVFAPVVSPTARARRSS